jgi:hypothetical protein
MINWNLQKAANRLGVTVVTYQDPDFKYTDPVRVRGISTGFKMALSPLTEHKDFVGMHELAHIVLGHTTNEQLMNARGATFDRLEGIMELEAHSVAFVIAEQLGTFMDAKRELEYIKGAASWLGPNGGPAYLNANAPRLQNAAQTILSAGL